MSVYQKRRQQLMQAIGSDAVAIVPSNHEIIRNGDATFPFRQNSDFFYLTGFSEPDAVLVLAPGREDGEIVLFNQPRIKEREIWDGPRAGQEGAMKNYGADQAFSVEHIDELMPDLLEGRNKIVCHLGINTDFDHQVMEWLNQLRRKVRLGINPPADFTDISHILHEMRIIKDDHEIELMRKATEISANAHKRAMQLVRDGLLEYQLEAEILHEFAYHGSRFPAYTSIVAGGENACVLHYVANSAALKEGDLVLIDAGGEYQHYASDITRTFPVNGRFSKEQKAIYECVLQAQLAVLDLVKPGTPWNVLQETAIEHITRGLVELGILEGDVDELIHARKFSDFYMHNIGHWIGIDVHDVGSYKTNGQWRVLEPGIVLTVEPGIYIASDNMHVDEKWRGIGVRIEDDVLVTKQGHEVLSAGVPKTVEEIEKLMSA